ncbi:CoA ester lyase [Phaeovibrio sulfidiphilus]|uniref:CoA ester lyase n=1 Tax=Phaeovibrio sulfidiphilus TaxID=1220600 RepID=A0A8J6YH51_9PROT|nr:CoA ester lyase [Phaeovibrio sulfidiphilus]MBE1236201.1 CoA ester lyase [Phaeovibrio sulfidiphilus]
MTYSRTTVPFLPLFVPASRPDRYARAASSGADVVLIDLEDAIDSSQKDAARQAAVQALSGQAPRGPVWIRINGRGSPWYGADVDAVARLPISGVVLPKIQRKEEIVTLRSRLGSDIPVISLIETVEALADIREIAEVSDELIFGGLDYALSVGSSAGREALLHARCEVVLAAVLAGKPAPIDGITLSYTDPASVEDDARYARDLGFGGRLLIHPSQVAPTLRGFAPSSDELEAAKRALASDSAGARGVDGSMVDTAVEAAARAVLERQAKVEGRLKALQDSGNG